MKIPSFFCVLSMLLCSYGISGCYSQEYQPVGDSGPTNVSGDSGDKKGDGDSREIYPHENSISYSATGQENINVPKTSGTYTCETCSKSHNWEIDENHMLWWDNEPHIPFGGFALMNPYPRIDNPFGLKDYNIWLGTEGNSSPEFFRQYINNIDKWTTEITNSGGTYTIQMGSGPSPPEYDASTLFLPETKKQILDNWKIYAKVIAKEGLRGLIIWNESDVNLRWPDTRTVKEYKMVLSEYAKELKSLVGDVPVSFKILNAGASRESIIVIEGATSEYASGLGLDIFALDDGCMDKPRLRNLVTNVVSLIRQRQEKTTLFWITEWGKNVSNITPGDYWSAFPPFSSKLEMECILNSLVDYGAKGFIYNAPGYDGEHSEYYQSYAWFAELKDKIMKKAILSTKAKN